MPSSISLMLIVAKNLDKEDLCPNSSLSPTPVDERTGRAVGLRPTVLCLPYLMPLHQQGFDCFPVLAGAQFLVSPAMLDVDGRVEIGVCLETADHTAKRLLIRSVSSVHMM